MMRQTSWVIKFYYQLIVATGKGVNLCTTVKLITNQRELVYQRALMKAVWLVEGQINSLTRVNEA